MGVDVLDESSVVLVVRIRTFPGKELAVGRALERLVEIAFDEHGVSWRDPTPIVMLNAPAVLGDAPPRRRLA